MERALGARLGGGRQPALWPGTRAGGDRARGSPRFGVLGGSALCGPWRGHSRALVWGGAEGGGRRAGVGVGEEGATKTPKVVVSAALPAPALASGTLKLSFHR